MAKHHKTPHKAVQAVQQQPAVQQPQPQRKQDPLLIGYALVAAIFATYGIARVLEHFARKGRPAPAVPVKRSYNWMLGCLGFLVALTGAEVSGNGDIMGGAGIDLFGLFLMFVAFCRWAWRKLARSAGKHFAEGQAQART